MNGEYQRPPVRVGILGLGRAVFDEHLPILGAHPALFDVVAACDLIKERRDRLAATCPNCRMFRQWKDLLDERDLDLVIVATPSTDHVKHALASLAKGFWTLVESPMALTFEDAQVLRGAAVKARNRLIVLQRGMFAPDFLLARQMMTDPRLGEPYDIRIRREDYVRRDDWQTVKRLGGGAAYYEMPNLLVQVLKLMPSPPIQMWGDLKRVASLGDAEDCVHVVLRSRTQLTADVEFNGGVLACSRAPAFVVRGLNGEVAIEPGASEGMLRVVDPGFAFPRRRSSVRTPGFEDMHEEVPVLETKVSLAPDTHTGPAAFWKCVYATVRTAAPFPLSLDDSILAVKFAHLMKKASPYRM